MGEAPKGAFAMQVGRLSLHPVAVADSIDESRGHRLKPPNSAPVKQVVGFRCPYGAHAPSLLTAENLEALIYGRQIRVASAVASGSRPGRPGSVCRQQVGLGTVRLERRLFRCSFPHHGQEIHLYGGNVLFLQVVFGRGWPSSVTGRNRAWLRDCLFSHRGQELRLFEGNMLFLQVLFVRG